MNIRVTSYRSAALAALIPAALLSGAAAYAVDSPSPASAPMAASTPTPAGTPTVSTPPASVPSSAEPTKSSCQTGYFEDKCIAFSIDGLPREIVAGDGWHEFTVRVHNTLSATLEDVDVSVGKQVQDLTPGMPGGDPRSVDLQAREPGSGAWRDQDSPDQTGPGPGTFTDIDFAPFQNLMISLRVRVAKDFPFTVTRGDQIGDVFIVGRSRRLPSDVPDTPLSQALWSSFRVLKPGSHTGGTTSAPTPSGGSTPNGGGTPTGGPATPSGEILAETGSSSDLWLLAGVGGAAVVAGAGVVYSARRRRAELPRIP
ncbi:LPXTG cell wall anchor domain-containing protein [Streptomyces sp. NPDC002306]